MLQRSSEWFEARCGLPTVSCFDQIISVKGERQKAYMGYLMQVAGERLSGGSEKGYQSVEMRIGIEREAEARMVYAMQNELIVDEVGFVLHPSGLFGGSPDGFVNHDGVIEIKNKLLKHHMTYLYKGRTKGEHYQQMQGYLLVSGRQWCDFVSYFPGLPLYQERIYRDKDFLVKMENELVAFCQELDAVCEKIMGIK
jgi:hypothetical protein